MGVSSLAAVQAASVRERSPLRAAEDELARAAELHITHRRACPHPGCAECTSLARDVLRLQQQVGLMRFDQAEADEL